MRTSKTTKSKPVENHTDKTEFTKPEPLLSSEDKDKLFAICAEFVSQMFNLEKQKLEPKKKIKTIKIKSGQNITINL